MAVVTEKVSDDNIYPSYSNFKISYDYICRKRYQTSKAKHTKQFTSELLFMEKMQDKALNGVRVHRVFTDNIWPGSVDPKLALKNSRDKWFTPKERKRLEKLLSS